ncbi:hypothetical protein ABEO75_02765 [Paenibacillus macerans]|uniref:hypothetical protein n=1 Tax=Paenibacillus macerans TaxID=44252 RepID=UPI002E1E41F4|nr:hypothetical protein [Paenibacillus macerans]
MVFESGKMHQVFAGQRKGGHLAADFLDSIRRGCLDRAVNLLQLAANVRRKLGDIFIGSGKCPLALLP